MAKRVTDLEKFALEEIWRPYQNLVGYETRLERLPVSLGETAEMLNRPSYWRDCVINRLMGIGVYFPAYIHHPLVDAVRQSLRHTGKGGGE